MELRNKVAVITGAAGNIGKAIAMKFVKEGAKVVLSDIDIDTCVDICDDINDQGYDAFSLECDATKKKDVQNLMKEALKKYHKIDILVNCASEDIVSSFFDMTEKDWDLIINTNLKGVFLPTLIIGKKMAEQKKGKIIFVTSIAGEVGFSYTSAFCASEAGAINLVRELALELSEHKININSITSGILPDEIQNDIMNNEQKKKEFIDNIPLGKVGSYSDIANAAVFLASEKSSYITGHNLVVDGGWLCQ